jgi:hypothetical protein
MQNLTDNNVNCSVGSALVLTQFDEPVVASIFGVLGFPKNRAALIRWQNLRYPLLAYAEE